MTASPFQSDTIILRPFEPDDVPALQECLNHPDLTGRRYVPWAFSETSPFSRKQVEEILGKWTEEEKGYHLAVVLSEDQSLIGHAECEWGWDPHCPSVSVVITPDHQRQGHGSNVIGLLLRYLFEYTPAHSVSCGVAGWDWGALRFVAHCGFQEGGRMRRVGVHQGKYFDLVVADILRPEWRARVGRHTDAA